MSPLFTLFRSINPCEHPDLNLARAKVSTMLLTSVEKQPYKAAFELKGENRRGQSGKENGQKLLDL